MTDADIVMHAISRDHRLREDCVDCRPLLVLHARLAASPAPDPGAGLREALAEIDQWLDELDSVSVDWAPAHSAPYVSKFVLRPGIQAILARHGFTAAPSVEPPETHQLCLHGVPETQECPECGFAWTPAEPPETA